MKVITEAILRDELRAVQPESYKVPEGKMLSPAAREYLQQRKIKIDLTAMKLRYNPVSEANEASEKTKAATVPSGHSEITDHGCVGRFTDFETGAYYNEKPEYMTHLHGSELVPKDHPKIIFRGKLDSTQALAVLDQAVIKESGGSTNLIKDIGEILSVMRNIMRCEVTNEPFPNDSVLGLTYAELRARSHDPMKYYSIKQMVLPDHTLGKEYALLNQLRTSIREVEVSAAVAFKIKGGYERKDIIEGLNRLSSAIHVMMCMYLAGDYQTM